MVVQICTFIYIHIIPIMAIVTVALIFILIISSDAHSFHGLVYFPFNFGSFTSPSKISIKLAQTDDYVGGITQGLRHTCIYAWGRHRYAYTEKNKRAHKRTHL